MSDAAAACAAGATSVPSDLGPSDEGAAVRVGGRVVDAREGRARLADAFGAVDVVAIGGPPLAAGDLAVVEGRVIAGVVREARVVFHQRHEPVAGGEAARFLYGGVGRTLRARAVAMATARAEFAALGFVEVETPARVVCPGLDVHLDAFRSEERYLITSPEYQMKRLVAGGVGRCVQFVRCFRKGERGPLHNPEFTMVEWYRAFAGYEDVMRDTEQLVCAVAGAFGGLRAGGRPLVLTRPFVRMTVREAFERYAATPPAETDRLAGHDEDEYFGRLVAHVEPALAGLDGPVFLTHFPAPQASLARRSPGDAAVAERFELYAGGVELCNGFGELTDADEQRARFENDVAVRRSRGMPGFPIDERFLRALGEGLPPCAGNALGFDRLFMLALGERAIDRVVAFADEMV